MLEFFIQIDTKVNKILLKVSDLYYLKHRYSKRINVRHHKLCHRTVTSKVTGANERKHLKGISKQ